MDVGPDFYLWVKALHIIAVIAWMAGLLYLPRLFVYHADAAPGSDKSETFKVMERRLYRAIMTPAMVVSVGLGAVLAAALGPALFDTSWFIAKMLCVVVLIAVHFQMGRWRRQFAADENRRPARFYRMVNEVPTLFMVIVVVMVVVKPF